jgi:glycerol-3-phosphate acyltransferase PlsY
MILYFIVSYLVGAIPFGKIISYLVGRVNIQEIGSGNIGATNVARVLGLKWGLLTLIADIGKGALMVKIANYIFNDVIIVSCIAVIVVFGHCYPVYLKFRGGKGVATACGAFLFIDMKAVLFSVLIFVVVMIITRIVSLSSIMAVLNFPILTSIIESEKILVYSTLLVALIIVIKHRENINRLMRGEEKRFSFRKKI